MLYADVIVDINTKSIDKPFTYGIPDSLRGSVTVGSLVTIPFGKSNNQKDGYVIDITDSLSFDSKKLKYILSVKENISFESEMISLAQFMKKRYFTTFRYALNSLIPMDLDSTYKKQLYVKLIKTHEFVNEYIETTGNSKRYKRRIDVLKYLIKTGEVKLTQLLYDLNVSKSVITSLENARFVDINNKYNPRIPYDSSKVKKTIKHIPNAEQQNAINSVKVSMKSEKNEVYVLHGVTGSGKTEVYLQLIEETIAHGKSAIFLIPEISLTHQTVRRVMSRFGDVVGVIHSRLSKGEKYDQWKMAKDGKIKVMIGPRTAIFTPFLKIGIIIIDEEHESTYKSEKDPKYHAREIAIKRASYHKCPVVLGSATPLIETYFKAMSSKYKLLELTSKATNDYINDIEIIDMSMEIKEGNDTIFSKKLTDSIKRTLQKNEQIILLLNSRGYSRFITCKNCGYVAKCSRCEIPFHYHKSDNALICHYCDNKKNSYARCPKCSSEKVEDIGIGTEKVEKQLNTLFPEARVVRMDYDTTSGKFGHDEIIKKFEEEKADILIGTQMVAKGHHFSGVTLVGVLAADQSLYIQDFRSSERTYSLITQVLGRAGRDNVPGKGIIQTYSPQHYAIMASKTGDYLSFYKKEIVFRKLMKYPPYAHILVAILTSKDEKYIIRLSKILKNKLSEEDERYEVLGPTIPARPKIAGKYRRIIYVKSNSYNLLLQIIEYLQKEKKKEDVSKQSVLTLDINPTYT